MCCDHVDGCMKPIKQFLQVSAAAIALSLGACSAGADRTIYELMVLKEPEPPKTPVLPHTTGELKTQVKQDGYPDADYIPNPERLPELSEEERAAMLEDLSETGRQSMENRVMTCGAEDPADCVE